MTSALNSMLKASLIKRGDLWGPQLRCIVAMLPKAVALV